MAQFFKVCEHNILSLFISLMMSRKEGCTIQRSLFEFPKTPGLLQSITLPDPGEAMRVCLVYIVRDMHGLCGEGGLMPGVLCSSLRVAMWYIHL